MGGSRLVFVTLFKNMVQMSNVPKNVLVLKKNLLHFLEIGGRGGVELNVKIIEGNPSLDTWV